jgi:hypothetical protein
MREEPPFPRLGLADKIGGVNGVVVEYEVAVIGVHEIMHALQEVREAVGGKTSRSAAAVVDD